MALHPHFPNSPHAILDPETRWFPAPEALRETKMDRLMPPLVPQLRRQVKAFRDSGYIGACQTSKSLSNGGLMSRIFCPEKTQLWGVFSIILPNGKR
jgi:type III restriction enzyme